MSRRLVALALSVVVLLGTGGYAVAQGRGSDPSYRTATARTGDVDRALNLTGTIAASGRRDLSFGISGTVASVRARAGQQVTAGQVLGTLDATALDAAVTRADATLAKAEAQLETDQDGQSSAVAAAGAGTGTGTGSTAEPKAATGSGSAGTGSGTAGTKPPTGTTAATLAELKKQQAAVRSAQTGASRAIATAHAALETQDKACAADPTTPADPTNGSSGDPSVDSSSGPSSDPTGTPDPSLPKACSDALVDVQQAQDAVADEQDTLQSALDALGQTLTKAMVAIQRPTQQAPNKPTAQTPTQAPTQTSQGSDQGSDQGADRASGTGQGGTPSAGSIASDQAAIDTAQARVTEAEAARTAATLTAPYDGRVLAVDVSRGSVIGESDVAVVLVGDGATTVATEVTVAQVPQVRRGQRARVTTAGRDRPLTGTVTEIGMLPSTSGSGSGTAATTYPVTLTLDAAASVPEGATASVVLVTGSARDVVTVPTSAVHTLGRTTVTVIAEDKLTPTVVTVGVVGPNRTSITSGLEAGQRVVIADLDEALPSGESQQGGLGRTGALRGSGGGVGGGLPIVTRQ